MRILILGASGMLGHRLWLDLSKVHQTWGTLRSGTSAIQKLAGANSDKLLIGVYAEHLDSLTYAFGVSRPDVVINCIGLIKQRNDADVLLNAIDLNARFPHQMANLCHATGSRLIHISTDCVFSGRTGMYTEKDNIDAEDTYGRTKALGEITGRDHCLTIRTSFIGHELGTNYGLVEWFLSQSERVSGYQKAIFSGFTTHTFSEILLRFILPRDDFSGLWHISSNPISKYDLLQLLNHTYSRRVAIEPNSTVAVDRSLDSSRFREAAGFTPPDWPQMIQAMAEHHIRLETDDSASFR